MALVGALEQAAHESPYRELYADKAYEYLKRVHGLPFTVMTPVKKQKGQEHLDAADARLSRAVSQVRQPVESIFNWIEEKPARRALTKGFSSMSSDGWPPPCSCGMSYRLALNSH